MLHSEVTLAISSQEEKLSSLMTWCEAEVKSHLLAYLTLVTWSWGVSCHSLLHCQSECPSRRHSPPLDHPSPTYRKFLKDLKQQCSPGRIQWKPDRSLNEKFLQVQDTGSLIESCQWFWGILRTPRFWGTVKVPSQHLYPLLEEPHQIIHAHFSEIKTLRRWFQTLILK